jgi:sirohydrochlorin ferrochelatase
MVENAQEKTAVLLLGHGSRAKEANDAMYRVAQDLRQTEQFAVVECAFLEMNQPDIAGGLTSCHAQGAKRIIIIPYFLHLGNHVQKDLPRLIGDWWADRPEVEIIMGQHLGYSPLLTQLVQERIAEAN